jgi:chromate transporter
MDDSTTTRAPDHVSFGEAFRFWLKLGFISFGGPTGQIAIMHQELVERRRWISEGRFLHALNYCMVLPGPEAQQLATYIGWLMHRTWGGIVAGGLFVLPSVFILIALSWVYLAYGDVPVIAGLFYGIKPAVTAIVLAAAHRIGSRALKHPALWAVAAAAFVAIFALKLPFPVIIIAAGLVGYFGGRYSPGIFAAGGGHGTAKAGHGPALIDDTTPTPPHALFSWGKFWGYLGAGLALWILVIGILCAAVGWGGTLTQMGWFFTKAALLTFGGAYAVLPYVLQGAVENHQWLTASQMIDGLALGETTPGPLIMVVAFVGFVGAWTRELFGSESLLLAGVHFHPHGRALRRNHARRSQVHCAADRHHRGGGGGHRQSCRVLRLPRAVAARPRRRVRLDFRADRRGRFRGAVPLPRRHHDRGRGQRARRPRRYARAADALGVRAFPPFALRLTPS